MVQSIVSTSSGPRVFRSAPARSSTTDSWIAAPTAVVVPLPRLRIDRAYASQKQRHKQQMELLGIQRFISTWGPGGTTGGGNDASSRHHSYLAHLWIQLRRLSRRTGLGLLRWGRPQPHPHHRANPALVARYLRGAAHRTAMAVDSRSQLAIDRLGDSKLQRPCHCSSRYTQVS